MGILEPCIVWRGGDTYRALSSGISAPRLFDGYGLFLGVLSFSWGDEEERMGML